MVYLFPCVMKLPLPKLKATILYFCEHTDPQFLGKVKLMKLFYFFDFLHVKRFGVPVTFDRYVNLEHGPIPSTIKNIVDELSCDSDKSHISDVVTLSKIDLGNGTMHKIEARRKLQQKELDYFSPDELETLREVCARFGAMNTGQIEDASHKEAPWSETEYLEDIPYSLAGKDPDAKYTGEDIDALLAVMR